MTIQIKPVELTAEGRLLLMLARDQLQPHQKDALPRLVAAVEDWDVLIQRCVQHFILPIALRHLASLPIGLLPAGLRERMRAEAFPIVARSLQIAAAQKRLVKKVLTAGRFSHAFVKGQALAGCYYQEPGSRFCRDVDVLVHRSDLVAVAEMAQACGYHVFPDRRHFSRRDLEAAAKFRPVLCLVGPDGVLVEVHDELDKTGLIFQTQALLSDVETKAVHGSELMVLPLTQHFVFVCLHSTRHIWSHLNWLIDMDAMMQHETFDETKILKFAKHCGILSTIEACLELYRVCGEAYPERAGLSAQGRDLFDALVMHVEKGTEIEFDLRVDRPHPDFSFAWQATHSYKRRTRMKMRFAFLKPNFKDYEAFPLPGYLHWVYYLTRPISGQSRRRNRGDSDHAAD